MSLYKMTRSSIRVGLRTLCRPEIVGIENVPTEGPLIIASNHLSFLDSIIIQALTPRSVSFFAKAEYFTTPGLKGKAMKTFFESVGSIPVQRGEQAASVAALESLIDVLESGEGIGIYPEGTRSRDGKLYRGRTGVGWLALTTGVPVIPVGLIGTENLQQAGSNTIKPTKFTIKFGEPLQFEKLGRKHPLPQRRQATDRIVDAIAALSGQERVEAYNQLPPDAK